MWFTRTSDAAMVQKHSSLKNRLTGMVFAVLQGQISTERDGRVGASEAK